jgi:ABC-type transporter Mla subunit MlaD
MASLGVRAGDIAPVTDANGNTITTYVMTRTTSGQRDTLESTGSARRDSVTAAHSNTLQNLHGRILKILATIDGLTIENQDLAGQVTGLSLALGELRTYVQTTGEETDETIQRLQSLIEQTATRLEITFSQTSERIDGVGNDLADAVAEISTYIRASSDGVEIGKSDSPYAARLTNDRLEFTENGTVVAYISNNKMYVTSVEATEYARLCCFEFFQRSSGAGVCRYRRIT